MHELATLAPPAIDTPAIDTPFVETLPTMTYDVVRHRGHWKVLHIGKHSAPHPNQKAAIEFRDEDRDAVSDVRPQRYGAPQPHRWPHLRPDDLIEWRAAGSSRPAPLTVARARGNCGIAPPCSYRMAARLAEILAAD